MKQESREYYNYWESLNVRVAIEVHTTVQDGEGSNRNSYASLAFYETDQPVNGTDTFATLEEAKKQGLLLVDRVKEEIIASLENVKEVIPHINEESKNFIGFNPDGGW